MKKAIDNWRTNHDCRDEGGSNVSGSNSEQSIQPLSEEPLFEDDGIIDGLETLFEHVNE